MAAVRAITQTLNRLAPARLLAGGWAKGVGSDATGSATRMSPGGRDRPAVPPLPREEEYESAGIEPHLEEMLRDPIVQQVMRADRVEAAEVRRVLRVPDPSTTASA
jgi:hypothetical protein